MKCQYCNYEWSPRKPDPKACPRCKRRLDYPRSSAKDPLSEAKNKERGFERTVYIMSLITPRLEEKGIKCVVVGGSAVEFYTRDWYASGDIDLAVTKDKRKIIDEIMQNLGFSNEGRMWVREDLNLYIETPGDVRDLDIARATKVETDAGYTYMIGLEDIILDRISAALHWKSESDKEQAIRMASLYYENIDWGYVRKLAKKDSTEKMLDTILEGVKNATG